MVLTLQSDELSFDEGDVIYVTEQEGEWWKGSVNGRTGILPANYGTSIRAPSSSCTYSPVHRRSVRRYACTFARIFTVHWFV